MRHASTRGARNQTNGKKYIGLGGRLLLALLGLALSGGLGHRGWEAQLVGVAGLIVFLAAVGAVEVTMAIWYGAQRKDTARLQ